MSGPVLPDGLRGEAFSLAEFRALHLPPSRLRHRNLHLPTRSVRATAPLVGVVQRARAFAKVLPPDCVFSHVTAAVILGLPLPSGTEDGPLLDVMRDTGRPRIRRTGCVGHRGLELRSVVRARELRVIDPLDTWVDLGEVLDRGLAVDDLVVVGDVLVNRGTADPAVLLQALQRRVRPRGADALTRAAGLVRGGTRSPMETRARLMFVRAGFPEPEVNGDVTDAAGEWLLEGDLVWREQRVIGEYQGSDHSSRRRRSADAHRAGVAHAHGWTVIELFAEDVHLAPRRRLTLHRFARQLGLDPRSLRID